MSDHKARLATTDYTSSQVTFVTTHDATSNYIPYMSQVYKVISTLGGKIVKEKSIGVTICAYDNVDSQFFTESLVGSTEDYLGFYSPNPSVTAT